MGMRKIKVLLACGSYELCVCLRNIIEQDARLCIVAEVSNAYEARDKIIEYDPDVMLLSNDIARMEGIVFLRKLMPQYPVATVLIGPPSLEEEAYEVGAKDFIAMTEYSKESLATLVYEEIDKKIKCAVNPNWISIPEIEKTIEVTDTKKKNIIAMGASTGGTEAICKVIKNFKTDIPGVVMVQHMPEGFTELYAQRLNKECEVVVKEAKSGDIVRSGQVLLAPGDRHMRLVKMNGIYQVECRKGPRVSGHCPSVDVLFESVAKVAGKDALGVLMTGMGADGAKGLLQMKKSGAQTIGQDEKTCIVYGMPKVAYEIGAVDYQVPLEQIAQKIYYLLDKR